MFNDVWSSLLCLSPGLIGMLVAVNFTHPRPASHPGVSIIAIGSGGIAGFIFLSVLIRGLDWYGTEVFDHAFSTTLMAVFFVASVVTLLRIWRSAQQQQRIRHGDPPASEGNTRLAELAISFSLAILILIVVCHVLFNSFLIPASGWDPLNSWATFASEFLAFDSSEDDVNGVTRQVGMKFPWGHPRHPPATYHLLSFNSFALLNASTVQGVLLPWLFAWFCGALVVGGFALSVSQSTIVMLTSIYLYVSFPLLENHAIFTGYPDLWITVIFLCSSAVLAYAIHCKNHQMTVYGIIFSLTPMLFKNTGIIYSLALLVPFLFVLLASRDWRYVAVPIIISVPICILVVSAGFDVTFFGVRYAIIHDEITLVSFGGWTLETADFEVTKALQAQGWAFFINQSFSILPLFYMISVFLACRKWPRDMLPARRSLIFLLLSVAALLVSFTLPQALSEAYLSGYAAPGADTGNSRFLMALGPPIMLTVAFWLESYRLAQGIGLGVSGDGSPHLHN